MLGEEGVHADRQRGVLTRDAPFAAAQGEAEWPAEDCIHNENGRAQKTARADNSVAPVHGPPTKQTTSGSQDNLSSSNELKDSGIC